jgi:hypothetical protein
MDAGDIVPPGEGETAYAVRGSDGGADPGDIVPPWEGRTAYVVRGSVRSEP